MVAVLGMVNPPRNFSKRPPDEIPQAQTCALHLQRICGTCANYSGALKPRSDDPQDSRANCASYNVKTHRLGNAWTCSAWTRKVEGAGNA